jgi:hypothetical protein
MVVQHERVFVHRDISDKNKGLFGFDDEDNAIELEDDWSLAHVMFFSGLFSSVSMARKNGWNKPVPNGFSKFTVGKNKVSVFILNKIDED